MLKPTMLSEVASVMENAHSIEWVRHEDSLIVQKDFTMCSCMKMLLKEKDLASRQELWTLLPAGHYVMLDN